MTSWNETTLAAVDDVYDREHASNGYSRYAEYLRLNNGLFRSSWTDEPAPVDDPAEFAVHAWTVASGPIMAPGYVRTRPDLRGISLHRDEDDHGLYAEIRIPLDHHQIGGGAKRFPHSWQDWTEDRGWGDSGEYPGVREPDDTKRPAVLASAVVRVSGREWSGLVTPTAYEGPTLVTEAMLTVAVVAQHVNDAAGPIVAQLLK
ncbi:hypothetical protein [Streptomyces sp. NRRL S-455]|uniref:hypothetical protein n=1 Tax=Streptomyces sp. NRRL S-455 TaxID=1463908 RepID=UPI0004C295FE|nr:hypothetical protein [Streptomyces sp. NRRL S-455]